MSAGHQFGGVLESHNYSASTRLGKARRSAKADERGATILEFAFVLVITFVLIFAIIDFARALYSYHFISEAAREGTRFASVRGPNCSIAAAPCPASALEITNYVLQLVPSGIDPLQVTVNPTWPPSDLPMCGGVPNAGCPVKVEVDYNFNFIFPVSFYNLAPISFMPSTIAMSSVSQMNISR